MAAWVSRSSPKPRCKGCIWSATFAGPTICVWRLALRAGAGSLPAYAITHAHDVRECVAASRTNPVRTLMRVRLAQRGPVPQSGAAGG